MRNEGPGLLKPAPWCKQRSVGLAGVLVVVACQLHAVALQALDDELAERAV